MSFTDEKLNDIFRLEEIEFFGQRKIQSFLDTFGSIKESKNYNDEDFLKLNISIESANFIRDEKFSNKILEKQYEKFERFNGLNVITFYDDNYPENLKNIPDPPLYLFYQGELKEEDNIAIGMVGARNISPIGCYVAQELSQEISKAGFTIVSGLAMGTDTISHKGALDANGRTLAVLGSGIDKEVNVSSRHIRKKIIEGNGAVISPFHIGMRAEKFTFPLRNRIISGLSLGTVIVEAALKSGSLITARYAIEQNREVFAVPNTIYKDQFRGTNSLIKNGEAKLIDGVKDVIDEMPDYVKRKLTCKLEKKKPVALTDKLEIYIFEALKNEDMAIDKLCEKLRRTSSDLMAKLFMMELNGVIIRKQGNIFGLK